MSEAPGIQEPHEDADPRLCDEDVQRIVALVADAAVMRGDIRRKRIVLMSGLSDLVDADNWLWSHCYIDQGHLRPVNLQFQQCGRVSLRGQVAYALRTFGAFGIPPENHALKELTIRGQHFTRAMWQLAGRDAWMNKKSRAYVYAFGIDDFVYSIVPTERVGSRTYFSTVALGRHVRRPYFTDRERKIIHIVTSSVSWLHTDGLTRQNADAVERLPTRLRCVLPMLIEGKSNRDIAEAHYLSLDTVKTYASDLYEMLGVSSRAELINKFAVGDGGERP